MGLHWGRLSDAPRVVLPSVVIQVTFTRANHLQYITPIYKYIHIYIYIYIHMLYYDIVVSVSVPLSQYTPYITPIYVYMLYIYIYIYIYSCFPFLVATLPLQYVFQELFSCIPFCVWLTLLLRSCSSAQKLLGSHPAKEPSLERNSKKKPFLNKIQANHVRSCSGT